jgi:hypothetical protein
MVDVVSDDQLNAMMGCSVNRLDEVQIVLDEN